MFDRGCSSYDGKFALILFGPGFSGVLGPGGEGERKMSAAHNSQTIEHIRMKLGGLAENVKLINLM